MTGGAKIPVFPLVRHLSKRVTPVLVRLPVTANQVTALSLMAGLAAAWHLTAGDHGSAVAAGMLFVVSYVLDNCDGEIARIKDQCSTFGMWFDTFVDWGVHTVFFVGLGIGFSSVTGNDVWLWLGVAAAVGGTLNFAIGLIADIGDKTAAAGVNGEQAHRDPIGAGEWVLFAFRELTRADFCFIVLMLAVFDLTWVLLPVGAVGAQVYWITQFFRGARDFHV